MNSENCFYHKFYDIHNFKNQKICIYLIIHIYYICLCDVKLPEEDRNMSQYYCIICGSVLLILVHLLAFCIKLFMKALT